MSRVKLLYHLILYIQQQRVNTQIVRNVLLEFVHQTLFLLSE
jgi:hypothetical protein